MQLINAVDLLKKTFPPPAFLVKGFLPEGLLLLASPPKAGKSWFCLDLATAVARGTEFMGLPTAQGDVLYLALEDHHGRLHNRLTKQLGGTPRPDRLTLSTDASDLDHGLVKELEDEWIAKVDDPRLIVFDTWAHASGGANEKPDYHRTVARVRQLRDLSRKHSISVLAVHHTKKIDAAARHGGDPFDEILGSQGFLGTVDTALLIRGQRLDTTATIHLTGRDVEDMARDARLDKASMRWDFTETSTISKLGLEHQKAQAFQVILAGGSDNAAVRAEMGISSQQASRLLRELKDAKLIESSGYNKYTVAPAILTQLNPKEKVEEQSESSESCQSSESGHEPSEEENLTTPMRAA